MVGCSFRTGNCWKHSLLGFWERFHRIVSVIFLIDLGTLCQSVMLLQAEARSTVTRRALRNPGRWSPLGWAIVKAWGSLPLSPGAECSTQLLLILWFAGNLAATFCGGTLKVYQKLLLFFVHILTFLGPFYFVFCLFVFMVARGQDPWEERAASYGHFRAQSNLQVGKEGNF